MMLRAEKLLQTAPGEDLGVDCRTGVRFPPSPLLADPFGYVVHVHALENQFSSVHGVDVLVSGSCVRGHPGLLVPGCLVLLEVQASKPEGFDEAEIRTISENARTLKSEASSGFKKEQARLRHIILAATPPRSRGLDLVE